MPEGGDEQSQQQQSWRERFRKNIKGGDTSPEESSPDAGGSEEDTGVGEGNGEAGNGEAGNGEAGSAGDTGASSEAPEGAPTRAERGALSGGSGASNGGGSTAGSFSEEDEEEEYEEEGEYYYADEDDDEEYDDEDYDEEEDRYESWREYFNENPRAAMGFAIGGAAIVIAVFLAILFLVTSLAGGGSEEEGGGNPPQNQQQPQQGAEVSGAPVNAGGLSVSTDGGQVTVDASGSAAVGEGGSWTGELNEGEQNAATVNLTPSSDDPAPGAGAQASMTSVLSEDGIRSWLGLISDTSRADGVVLEASQSSDPGTAALDGEMALVKGTYVAKGSEDGYSASGTYQDTLLDQSTVRRTYEETYVVGGGETQNRSWQVEYNVSGDAALVPFLIGYAPPEGVGSGPEGTPQDEG